MGRKSSLGGRPEWSSSAGPAEYTWAIFLLKVLKCSSATSVDASWRGRDQFGSSEKEGSGSRYKEVHRHSTLKSQQSISLWQWPREFGLVIAVERYPHKKCFCQAIGMATGLVPQSSKTKVEMVLELQQKLIKFRLKALCWGVWSKPEPQVWPTKIKPLLRTASPSDFLQDL